MLKYLTTYNKYHSNYWSWLFHQQYQWNYTPLFLYSKIQPSIPFSPGEDIISKCEYNSIFNNIYLGSYYHHLRPTMPFIATHIAFYRNQLFPGTNRQDKTRINFKFQVKDIENKSSQIGSIL